MKRLAHLQPIAIAAMLLGAAPALAAPPKEPLPDWGAVLPKADLDEGQHEGYKCMQCHDVTNTKLNQFGPPLWGVVGRARATAPGFQYSPPMKASHDPWTFDRLFIYLKSPQLYVPGTPMSFSGIRSAKNRINAIAWLRAQSDNPVPIPPPKTGK